MDKLVMTLDDKNLKDLQYAGNNDIVFDFVAQATDGKEFRVIIKRITEQYQAEPVAPKCFDMESDLTEDDIPF